MPHADVAGRSLHYLRRGEGEPLLLIMGLSGTHRSWGEPVLEMLEPGLELITYDHRGMGLSGPSEGPFSIGDLADDALGLLDALGLESAHVLGISMGGMVAQELVLRAPGRVRTLTLGCTYAGGPESKLTDPEVIQRLVGGMTSGDVDLALRTSWEVNVSPQVAQDEELYAAFRAAALEVPSPLPMIMEQMRATVSHDTSARLGSIEAPTLVVHGDLDQMLDVANGRAIAAAIPGSQLEVLEGVGHLFWVERPEESAALIRGHALAGAAQ